MEINNMNTEKAKAYLSGCAMDAGLDLTKAAMKGWKNPVSPSDPIRKDGALRSSRIVHPVYPFRETTVDQHDKRWHGGNYSGGACKWREDRGMKTWKKGGDPNSGVDDLSEDGEKSEVSWSGALEDMSNRELSKVADDFFAKYGDAIYDAVGEGGGTYVRGVRSASGDPDYDSAYEYDVRDLVDDDLVWEEIVDALPSESKDLDAESVVKKVAKNLTRNIENRTDAELGKGRAI